MADFKVRCLTEASPWFTKGKIYEIKSGKITDDEGGTRQCVIHSLNELNNLFVPDFELVTEPELPRICYILGGEDYPLKPHERFTIDGVPNNPHYFSEDMCHLFNASGDFDDCYVAFIINHPEKIIRRPQFDENEIALLKAFHALGYNYWCRGSDDSLWASEDDPNPCGCDFSVPSGCKSHHLDNRFLPHLGRSQKVNAATYLESEESK